VAALEQGQAGEVYNVASGVVRSIQNLLDALLAAANRSIKVEIDPARLRPSDIPRLHGDATKLKTLTGWQPTIPFNQTLQDLLNYERENYK
jgi:GDP-4-dehydro-6-deoxy-D-mannose reductase